MITGIHEEKRAALGEVTLKIEISRNNIPIDAIVSNATNYSILVGNEGKIPVSHIAVK